MKYCACLSLDQLVEEPFWTVFFRGIGKNECGYAAPFASLAFFCNTEALISRLPFSCFPSLNHNPVISHRPRLADAMVACM
jgi:hypothetical protein